MADEKPEHDTAGGGFQTFVDQDHFLATLVNIANETDVAIGITLSVGSVLVSGSIVSWERYFAGVASDLAGAGGVSELNIALKNGVEHYAKMCREEMQERIENGKSIASLYIHLKDARFFTPGAIPMPTNRSVWWRGRMSEVEGFSIGLLA